MTNKEATDLVKWLGDSVSGNQFYVQLRAETNKDAFILNIIRAKAPGEPVEYYRLEIPQTQDMIKS